MSLATRLLALLLLLPLAPAAQPVWVPLDGPGAGPGGLLAADAAGTFYRAEGSAVLRSTDGGATWAATGYPGATPRSLDVAPDGRVLVAADRVWRYDGTAWADLGLEGAQPQRVTANGAGRLATVVGIPRDCTVAISNDDGQTWTTHAPVGHSTIPGCVDAHVADDGHVFAVWQSTPTMPLARVYTSADGGATWTSLSLDYAARLVRGQHGGLFLISTEIWAMTWPGHPARLRQYADGAWTVLLHREVTGITTRADGTILVGYPHSLGTLDGTPVAQISAPRHIAVSASGAVLVSSADHGRLRYDGARWRQEGAPPHPVNLVDASGGGLVASTGWPGAVLRHDGDAWVADWGRHRPSARAVLNGETWYAVGGWQPFFRAGAESRGYNATYASLGLWRGEDTQPTPLPYSLGSVTESCDYVCIVPSVVVANDVLLAGVVGRDLVDIIDPSPAGVYRSDDAGETWTRTLPDVPGCHLAASGTLAVVASTPCLWWGWPDPPLASRSLDGGLTWAPVEAGLPAGDSRALLVGPDATAYLAHSADVFRLDGDAWTPMHLGTPARALATSADGRLLALTASGLRAWDGVNWTWVGTPPGRELRTLSVGDDGTLYLGTDAGVYATDGPFIVSAEEPLAGTPLTALGAPFPNPSRVSATVPFALAEAGPATLALYDLLGRRVAVLVEGPLAAGPHEAALPEGLAPGVYVVELRAGGERHAHRLVRLAP